MYPIYDWGRFSFVIDNQFGYNPIRLRLVHRKTHPVFGPYRTYTVTIPRRLHVRRSIRKVLP